MPNRTGVVRFTGKLNNANDTNPGGGDTAPGFSPGQLGAEIEVDAATAAVLSDTTVATLKSGRYRYVITLSTGTTAPARGRLAMQSTSAQIEGSIVHSDGAAVDDGKCAGVFLNTVTKGKHTWIQVGGNATVLFRAVADTTDGNAIVVATTEALADSIADATAVTHGKLKGFIGTAIGTVTTSALNAVLLKLIPKGVGGV